MTHRRIALALIVVMGLAACTPTQPTQPPNVYVDNHTITTINNGGGGSSPAPGSALPGQSSVKISAFGQNCPVGVAAPSDGHVLRVGCQLAVTCTPKGPSGEMLPPAVTGTSPDFFGLATATGNVRVSPWDSEPYNLNVVGVQPGPFTLSCTVRGLKSDPNWDGTVVPQNATGFSTSGANRVVYEER